jgi:hypothetical protein
LALGFHAFHQSRGVLIRDESVLPGSPHLICLVARRGMGREKPVKIRALLLCPP